MTARGRYIHMVLMNPRMMSGVCTVFPPTYVKTSIYPLSVKVSGHQVKSRLSDSAGSLNDVTSAIQNGNSTIKAISARKK